MQIRRLVTGLDAEGRAVVVSDGPPPRNHDLVHVPRMSSALLWATAPDEPLPLDGADPTPHLRSQLPLPGGTSFLVVTFPPDSVYADPAFDAAAAAAEQRLASPGITELFEPDNPGMHTTDTVDYTVVLAGEVWLELDDGQLSHLRAGDTVVQNGTRHAWRNLGTEPVTLAVVQVGANRHGRLPPRSRSGGPSRHLMIFAGSSQGPLPPQDEITLKFWPPITGQIFSAGTTGARPRRGERQAGRRLRLTRTFRLVRTLQAVRRPGAHPAGPVIGCTPPPLTESTPNDDGAQVGDRLRARTSRSSAPRCAGR